MGIGGENVERLSNGVGTRVPIIRLSVRLAGGHTYIISQSITRRSSSRLNGRRVYARTLADKQRIAVGVRKVKSDQVCLFGGSRPNSLWGFLRAFVRWASPQGC